MAISHPRSRLLYLPLVRGFFNPELGRKAKARVRASSERVGADGLWPADDAYTAGSICTDADVRDYYRNQWASHMSDICAVIAIGGNFMEERAFQDTLRLLPSDVPVFLVFQNDDPNNMAFENRGDAYCGALSIHRNARMIGRTVVASRGVDMANESILDATVGEYLRIARGIEAMRNMRVAMLGVNPVEFATTFTNQVELFRLGFSIHTYELLELWGATVLAEQQRQFPKELGTALPGIRPTRPVLSDDPRLAGLRERVASLLNLGRVPAAKVDLMLRCLLWISDTFDADSIDVGGIHCWTAFEQYFQIAPCTFSALANSILAKPLVCETDICHAIIAGVARAMTGKPGVILDLNNPGWDPRVVSMFHCSQTPPEWIEGRGEVAGHNIIEDVETVGRGNAFGVVEGGLKAVPFTGVSAATSSTSFDATVFQGRILRESSDSFGSNGWAFIPNNQDLLDVVHQRGIHHCVLMEGHLGQEVAKALSFRGLQVADLSVPVPSIEDIEAELGPRPATGRGVCPLHSR